MELREAYVHIIARTPQYKQHANVYRAKKTSNSHIVLLLSIEDIFSFNIQENISDIKTNNN